MVTWLIIVVTSEPYSRRRDTHLVFVQSSLRCTCYTMSRFTTQALWSPVFPLISALLCLTRLQSYFMSAMLMPSILLVLLFQSLWAADSTHRVRAAGAVQSRGRLSKPRGPRVSWFIWFLCFLFFTSPTNPSGVHERAVLFEFGFFLVGLIKSLRCTILHLCPPYTSQSWQ